LSIWRRWASRSGCRANAWSLQEGWQKELRDLGTRGDIIKQIHDVVRGDSSYYRVVHAGEPLLAGAREGQHLVGRVAGKGLSDEMKGTFYAVLEAPNGFAYHVPLDARTAEAVAPGDLVSSGRGRSWRFGRSTGASRKGPARRAESMHSTLGATSATVPTRPPVA
jgi:hypothetical protein